MKPGQKNTAFNIVFDAYPTIDGKAILYGQESFHNFENEVNSIKRSRLYWLKVNNL